MQSEKIIRDKIRDEIKKEMEERVLKPFAESLVYEVSEETKPIIYNIYS